MYLNEQNPGATCFCFFCAKRQEGDETRVDAVSRWCRGIGDHCASRLFLICPKKQKHLYDNNNGFLIITIDKKAPGLQRFWFLQQK